MDTKDYLEYTERKFNCTFDRLYLNGINVSPHEGRRLIVNKRGIWEDRFGNSQCYPCHPFDAIIVGQKAFSTNSENDAARYLFILGDRPPIQMGHIWRGMVGKPFDIGHHFSFEYYTLGVRLRQKYYGNRFTDW